MIRSFNRFELKYLIPVATRDALIEEIVQQMRPDSFGDGGTYSVNSLYYDTRDLQFCRAKLDGIKFRRKVRVRMYGEVIERPAALAMVEIKQRINRTVQKRRLRLPLRDAYALCAGDLDLEVASSGQSGGAGQSDVDARDLAIASEVTFLVRALNLFPTCVVGYQRQAFVGGQYEPGLRLTFDQAMWCRPGNALLSDQGNRHYFVPPDWMVLEVKMDHAVPLWVSRMLARHHVALRRFSKYVSGVIHLERQRLLQTGLRGEAAWMS